MFFLSVVGEREENESEMTRISGLESNLYGNRTDTMTTNSRIYDDKKLNVYYVPRVSCGNKYQ